MLIGEVKKLVHEKNFPKDLENAYRIGEHFLDERLADLDWQLLDNQRDFFKKIEQNLVNAMLSETVWL